MNRAKALKIALYTRKNNLILAKKLQAKLKADFLSILDTTDINKATFSFNFDFKKLKNRLKKTLVDNFKDMFGDKLKFNSKLWNVKIENPEIVMIHKKIEKQYVKTIATKVTKIADRVEKNLKSIIKEGVENGLSYQELANNIKQTVTTISDKRSYVIAQTETNSLSSNIDHEMAEDVGMSKKTWIHTGAGKTDRITHAELNGVTLEMDQLFDVGGTMALRPFAENLGPEDVINCHCILIYE